MLTRRDCEGELTQTRERGNLDLSEDAYLRIIDGKTAELCAQVSPARGGSHELAVLIRSPTTTAGDRRGAKRRAVPQPN